MQRFWLLTTLAFLGACDSAVRDPVPFSVGARQRTSPQLEGFSSCDALAEHLRESISEEMRVQLLQYQNYPYYLEGDAAEPTAGAANDASDSTTRQEGVDFSGTNNQEAGVDEADFVKTDGYGIYVLNGSRVEAFEVPNFGELVHSSTTEIEGWPTEMLLAENRVVVFSYVSPWNLPEGHPLRDLIGRTDVDGYDYWYRSQSLTKVTVLDMIDPTQPSVVRELYLEGYYQTARRIDSTVRMLSYSWFDIPGLVYWPTLPEYYWQLDADEQQAVWQSAVADTIAHNDEILANTSLADLLPALYTRDVNGTWASYDFTSEQCQSFAASQDATSHGFMSILSLDLLGDAFSFDADHIVSNWGTVYASTDTLVIAEPSDDWWWFWNNSDFEYTTNIHRFDISQAGATVYTGSGRVDGWVGNQFSLSEKEGLIRVAATTNAWNWWWDDNATQAETHIYVLGDGDDGLELRGQVGGIALGEQLWSARFVDDKAFLVTFQNTDPLWTVDLSNPTAPAVVGELEVPGVSTYIHPIENDQLLTIGYGDDWTATVSMFNVGDMSAPTLYDNFDLAPPSPEDGWSWAYSEAQYQSKAFQYWAPQKLLAVPVSTYRSIPIETQYGTEYGYEYVSKLELIRVDPYGTSDASPLTHYGDIDHSNFFNEDPYSWWSYQDIRRSIFMGDFIYAISDKGITAHRLSDLSLVASEALPGSMSDYPIYSNGGEGDVAVTDAP